MDKSMRDAFAELKQALQDIDASCECEQESEDVKLWTAALQSAVAGDPDFAPLGEAEMATVADTARSVSFDADRISRLRGHFRTEFVTNGDGKRAVASFVAAAIFRREGDANPAEHKVAQESLDRIRRLLDEEDD